MTGRPAGGGDPYPPPPPLDINQPYVKLLAYPFLGKIIYVLSVVDEQRSLPSGDAAVWTVHGTVSRPRSTDAPSLLAELLKEVWEHL